MENLCQIVKICNQANREGRAKLVIRHKVAELEVLIKKVSAPPPLSEGGEGAMAGR